MTEPKTAIDGIVLRPPQTGDGAAMWTVAKATGSLDINSSYLYLLLARDFAETCVVAEQAGQIIGFASGYRRPEHSDVVFLWQVGVHPHQQGHGLGKRLVQAFLQQPGAASARWLETTIAPDNAASRALFTRIAEALKAECRITPCFAPTDFPEPGHSAEELFTIGPYRPLSMPLTEDDTR